MVAVIEGGLHCYYLPHSTPPPSPSLPHSQILSDLAQVCAGVSCSCGPKFNKELMGALRAICIPSHIVKSSNTGYSVLAHKHNVRRLGELS